MKTYRTDKLMHSSLISRKFIMIPKVDINFGCTTTDDSLVAVKNDLGNKKNE